MINSLKENIVLKKSIDFSLAVIAYCEKLDEKRKFIISNQLLRSATSIGANIHEAQNAESRADFIHKMKIAAKELEEVKYWLTLCEQSPTYAFEPKLKLDAQELGKIIFKILSTSKKNQLLH
jgi:four helix bundle protein